jgi:hypothetical protein
MKTSGSSILDGVVVYIERPWQARPWARNTASCVNVNAE